MFTPQKNVSVAYHYNLIKEPLDSQLTLGRQAVLMAQVYGPREGLKPVLATFTGLRILKEPHGNRPPFWFLEQY